MGNVIVDQEGRVTPADDPNARRLLDRGWATLVHAGNGMELSDSDIPTTTIR